VTGATVPIAPIPLARSARRLAMAPVILFVAGAVAVVGGALLGALGGIALVAAGLIVVALSAVLWLMLVSVRLYVEVATLRVRWIGGERRYTLARGAVTRVPLQGPEAARLRPHFGAFGWALGRGTLRGDEPVEMVRLSATPTMILVPTDRGRVAVAPASEEQFLSALAAAARIQQRLDEVAERARAFMPPPRAAATAPTAQGAEEEGASHVLTGIQRAILEQRLAEQRAAALAAAEAERQAAIDATRMAEFMAEQQVLEAAAVVPAPAGAPKTARPRLTLPRPRISLPCVTLPHIEVAPRWERVRGFLVPAFPVLVAAGVWVAAAVQQRLGLPVEQLRPVAVALLAVGPAAALAGIAAKVWFPRLVGLVAVTSLAALVLVGRALLG